MSKRDLRFDIQHRVREMGSAGCEIVLHISPARRMAIADRLDPALPPGWKVVSEFHREVDAPSTAVGRYDSYFHVVRTHNDRVDTAVLLEFGERFEEIDSQLTVEQAREDSPEVWEESVETLGREGALGMFSDIGGGENLVRLGARADVESRVEALLMAPIDTPLDADEVASKVTHDHVGEVIRVEPTGDGRYLFGGDLTANIEAVRELTEYLADAFGVDRADTTLVCSAFEVTGE